MKKLLLSLMICLLLAGCANGQAKPRKTQFFAMDTIMEITIYDHEDYPFDRIIRQVQELEQKISVTDPQSEISLLNRSGTAELSDITLFLILEADYYSRKTDSALDITLYPLVKAWGFTEDTQKIPPEETINSLLKNVNFRKISREGNTVTLKKGMEIDLGCVAKGFTSNMLTMQLRKEGITSALINLGGNVQVIGKKPDGTPWQIGVRDPNTEGSLGILSASDCAVITSGKYERFFVGEDGERYWHILDPDTGKPARSGLASVTVIGSQGLCCDALSTAFFVMGEEKATEYWQTYQNFQMILVTDQGEVLITPGLQDDFRLNEGSSYKLRVVGHA